MTDRTWNTPTLMPATDIRGPLRAGALIVLLGFGGMLGWAAFAPLHSAVVAAGSLVPETGRKAVKSAEGGPVTEVLVHEGEKVARGQVLLRLDQTEAQARLAATTAELRLALARSARLDAQIADAPAITWPAELIAPGQGAGDRDPALTAVLQNQQTLFEAEKRKLDTDNRTLAERAAALRREAASLSQQRGYIKHETGIVAQQRDTIEKLLANGNATRTQLNEMRKEEARVQGRDSELAAAISDRESQALQADSDRARLSETKRADRLAELQQVRSDAQRLSEARRDAANRLANREVRSPEDGTVTGLGSRAAGMLIQPGETMLEIVPDEKQLLVELQVAPKDIASVSKGLAADVVMTAYDTRTIGTLAAVVDYVSADRVEDPLTRASYFLVRLRLDQATPHAVGALRIVAGMPVEAHILIAERTPLDYLLAPITRSYKRAFVQQ
jgi:HlyD family type I secretion membrane fusion protein